ncbi:MAG: GHKL domain-containing protein [Burkholderiales bacterium]|nr:GHKL domain-containing protein [Burkholderiales bacterium]
MDSIPGNKKRLEEAFSIFTQASEQLSHSYQALQQRVEQLTSELAVANGELRSQFIEKEALSERLSLILSALPGGVVVLDASGKAAEANPASLAMFGDVVGKSWADDVESGLQQTGTPGEWILQGARRLSIAKSSLGASDGQILMIQDITETHNMKMQMQRNQRLSAMGEMAASLAHQLRTPLATAMLYTSHLGKEDLSQEERGRFAEKSLARLRHLEQLIKDMLLFVKGETVGDEDIQVSSLLGELQQVIDPQMKARGLAFELRDESRGAALKGSRKALSGALLNLLENAMQASTSGGRITLCANQEDGYAVIAVKDEGRGVESRVRERLFEPFFTTRQEGTGLGLAIVRAVVQSHGGRITVKSATGHGSEFILELPTGLRLPAEQWNKRASDMLRIESIDE